MPQLVNLLVKEGLVILKLHQECARIEEMSKYVFINEPGFLQVEKGVINKKGGRPRVLFKTLWCLELDGSGRSHGFRNTNVSHTQTHTYK